MYPYKRELFLNLAIRKLHQIVVAHLLEVGEFHQYSGAELGLEKFQQTEISMNLIAPKGYHQCQ